MLAAARLELTAVDLDTLDALEIYAVQAANIDQSHFGSAPYTASAEGLTATDRTELVLDQMLVEGVRGELLRAG
jgi:hypothetical protein